MFLQRLSSRARRELCEIGEAECWMGLHYPVTINVSTNFLVGLSKTLCWRMPAGVHGTRPKTLAGSKPVTVPSNGFSNLSSIVVAGSKCLRRMQEELHGICGFPVRVRAVPLLGR
jgi:hypothetical protein